MQPKTVYLKSNKNRLAFSWKVNARTLVDFTSAINILKMEERRNFTLDFSKVTNAYPDGMIPIIATVVSLRNMGWVINFIPPTDSYAQTLFQSVNWSYYLCPDKFLISDSTHDRHLVTKQFRTETEQARIVDDFMNVVLGSMELPRDIISGLEWSMNELTDNVLNHANSKIGGFIQATTYPKNGYIAFAIADSGIGILESLREGIPTLRTDSQAIGEAIKYGVTRNPKYGQGNGLAGSMRIATLSGGSFDVLSGTARLLIKQDETTKDARGPHHSYQGTVICGQINTNPDFIIGDALNLGTGIDYTPVDIIEMQYEVEDKDCLNLKMKQETTGFGSRKSGLHIRTKILNLMNAEPRYPLVIDWEGVPVISSSFADELMGKLFLKMGAMAFAAKMRNINMENLIQNLLDKAIAQRLTQANDE